MADDPVDCLQLFDKRDDAHLATTRRADQWIHLIDLADHLRPALRWSKRLLLFDGQERVSFLLTLADFSSVGMRIETVVADHVFTDSLSLVLGLRPDLAVDVETCVVSGEDFLHKLETDELFPKQEREELSGEESLDKVIMET